VIKVTIQNELKEFKNIIEMEEKIKKQKEEITTILIDEITKLLSPLLSQQEKDDWFDVVGYDENEWGLNIFVNKNYIPSKIIDELVKYGFELEIHYDKYCGRMRICLE